MKPLRLIVAALLMQSALLFAQDPTGIYDNAGRPDLFIDSQRLVQSPDIVTRNFSKKSCELEEGSIGAAGMRRLLRFDQKIVNGGDWYPQLIGTEVGTGTDRRAGKRARFFMTGRSTRFIEFER